MIATTAALTGTAAASGGGGAIASIGAFFSTTVGKAFSFLTSAMSLGSGEGGFHIEKAVMQAIPKSLRRRVFGKAALERAGVSYSGQKKKVTAEPATAATKALGFLSQYSIPIVVGGLAIGAVWIIRRKG